MKDDTLENLLLDEKWEKFTSKINKFNLFSVLNVSGKETIISSTLRWLLDPRANHGLGDYVLRKFLSHCLKSNSQNEFISMDKFSVVNLEIMNLSTSYVRTEEVFPEKKRGDISILNEDNNFYVLIENKVFSREREDQTPSYISAVRTRYPDSKYKKLFIYLHPEGQEAEAPEFLIFSYSDLITCLKEVLSAKLDELSAEPLFLIQQFISNIEDNILEEGEIDRLALELYLKHTQAIERIYSAKPKHRQYYISLGEQVSNNLGSPWTFRAQSSYCAIFKDEWQKILYPTKTMPGIHYEFAHLPNKIGIFLHTEDMGDIKLKNLLKKYLEKTKISNVERIDLTKSMTIYSSMLNQNVDIEKIDQILSDSASEMIKFIENTVTFLDEAIEKTIKTLSEK